MNNYKLYIGLNVAGGKDWEKEEGKNLIIKACRAFGISALSLSDCLGVYTYDNGGQTVEEHTIILTLVDCPVDIEALTNHLKKVMSQESIMVEKLQNAFTFI